MFKIKWFFIGFFILMLTFGLSAGGVKIVKAAEPGAVDQVDLHIKTEVSADANNWINYSGTEESGSQTLTVAQGGTLYFRIKLWNTGTRDALNAEIEGSVDNSGYVNDLDVSEADLDGDLDGFAGFTFGSGGVGQVDEVAQGSTEDTGFDGLQGTIQLGTNFPVGQTVLTGTVNINDYDPEGLAYNPFQLIRRAHADGVNRESAVRIAVNVSTGFDTGVNNKVSPSPTASQNAAAAQISTLPQTGGSCWSDFELWINKLF